jgi:hypothetical protein
MFKVTFVSLSIVAIALLLLPITALAQEPSVTCKGPGDSFTVDFEGSPIACCDPSTNECDSNPCSTSEHGSGEVSGYDFRYYLSPGASTKIITNLISQPCNTSNPFIGGSCGDGDLNGIWGKGDYSVRVFELTHEGQLDNGQPFVVNAATSDIGPVSLAFPTSRGIFTCEHPIKGAGTPPPPPIASSVFSEVYTLPGVAAEEKTCSLLVTFNPLTAQVLFTDETDPCYELNQNSTGFVPIGTIAGEEGEIHVTDKTIVIHSESPACYTYYYSGKACQYCW